MRTTPTENLYAESKNAGVVVVAVALISAIAAFAVVLL